MSFSGQFPAKKGPEIYRLLSMCIAAFADNSTELNSEISFPAGTVCEQGE